MAETPKTTYPEAKDLIDVTKHEVKTDIEQNNKHYSIEDLKFNEKNETMKSFMNGMDSYFDFKLDKKFNKKQKDNIKLVLISQISSQINSIGEKSFTDKINTLFKNIPTLLENKNNDEIKKTFLALGLPDLQKSIDKNIDDINKEKNDKNFNKLKTSFSSIGLQEKDFKSIQGDITKTDKNFRELSEKADGIKEMAEEMGMGKELGGILEYIEKEWPFLGKLLAMIFGISKGISNNSEKAKKSTDNLKTFLEKDKDKSPLDKIERRTDLKEELSAEKLKEFYSYLNSKGIKHEEENFWQEFLTGKDKNGNKISDEKIIALNKLLLSTQDTKLKGTLLKSISLDKFIETLNGLDEIEIKGRSDEKIEKLEKEKANATAERKEEIKKEIEKEKTTSKLSFEDLLKQNKIRDKEGNIVDLKAKNKFLEIGGQEYSISISYFGERFISIMGTNGNYIITAKGPYGEIKKKLTTQQIKIILKDLVADDKVDNPKFEVGEYKVNLQITKKA